MSAAATPRADEVFVALELLDALAPEHVSIERHHRKGPCEGAALVEGPDGNFGYVRSGSQPTLAAAVVALAAAVAARREGSRS